MILVSSLVAGKVREDQGIINVVPLFEKGTRNNPGNSRPWRLTPVVGKLLERIYSHLEENGLIMESQHGFVCSKSCRF